MSQATFDRQRTKRISYTNVEQALLEDKPQHESEASKQIFRDTKIPINNVSWLSYMFASWLTPLVMKMYKDQNSALDANDIWACSDLESCSRNTKSFQTIWNEEIKSKGEQKASLFQCWYRFCRKRFLASLLLIAVNALASFVVSAYLLKTIIVYLERSEGDLALGIGLAVSMLIGNIIRAGTSCFVLIFGAQTGVRFRAAFLGIAYRKMLTLRQIKGKDLAEMITIFGGDGFRVYMNCVLFEYLLSLPVYMVIGIVYSYYLLGPCSLVALAVFIIGYLLQGVITKLTQTARRKTLIYTDKRIRKITEVLNNIKFIKIYGWEEPFLKTITDIRNKEKRYLMASAVLSSVGSAVIPVTPTLASVAAIAVYKVTVGDISASTAFAFIGTLHFMKAMVIFMPYATRTLAEVTVSFERMKKLLLKEEFTPHSNACKNSKNAIEIENSCFIWNGQDNKVDHLTDSQEEFQLSNITVNVEKGKLIGICGVIGAGKSSLLDAILGRMHLTSGSVAVDGEIANCPQQAWIFNGSIRENILFGRAFDVARYQDIISVCGLQKDLVNLDNGDLCEIGDRGINLSGGQKQRLSLARAMYSDKDIFLLDDPLSAVDVVVGKHIFDEGVKGILKGKTILLVTHQYQYMKHCDDILVMEHGEITEHGTHEELLRQDGYYKSILTKVPEKENESTTENTDLKSELDKHQQDVKDYLNGRAIIEETDQKPISERDAYSGEQTSEKYNNEDEGNDDINERSALRLEEKDEKTFPYDKSVENESKLKGKLITQEDMEQGHVKLRTYKSYIDSAGGLVACLAIIIFFSAASGSVIFSDWWLGIWIKELKKVNAERQDLTSTSAFNATLNTVTNISIVPTASLFEEKSSRGQIIRHGIYLIIYTAAVGVIVLLTILRGVCGAAVMITASVKQHKHAFQNVMKATMKFFESNPSGRILNRFSKDTDEVDVNLPQTIDSLLQLLISFTMAIVSAAVVIPWILIALVPISVLFAVLKNMSGSSVRQLKRIMNITTSPLLTHVKTTAQGLSTIASLGQQTHMTSCLERLVDSTTSSIFLFDTCMRWIGVRLDLTAAFITIATSVALLTTKGTIEPALAALSLTLCIQVVGNMQMMVRMMNETEAKFTSVERLQHYVQNVSIETTAFKSCPNNEWPNQGRITFHDVVLKYNQDRAPVLKGISFDVNPTTKVGVIGRTGAGKSSIVNALLRLVDVTSGRIIMDGINIADIPISILRSRIAVIPQDPVLVEGTLRYNLDPFGKYNDSTIWKSLDQIYMKQTISKLDQGLDCQIQENGDNFSIGERQLLCLARCILRKNKILILDEATSLVDVQTDAMIQKTIKEALSRCTVLAIAHRLPTLLNYELILVLDNGKIIETGRPKDLLSKSDSYLSRMIAIHSPIKEVLKFQ